MWREGSRNLLSEKLKIWGMLGEEYQSCVGVSKDLLGGKRGWAGPVLFQKVELEPQEGKL